MAETPKNKQKGLSKKKKIILGIVLIILCAVLAFLGLFLVTNVEVTGNSRYTNEEIESMALTNPLTGNSVLASAFFKHLDMEEVPFMKSVDIEYVDRNSIRLHVTEKTPIGYIQVGGQNIYFDADGQILERLAEGEIETVVTDVPRIEGLTFQEAENGEKLTLEDDSLFYTITALVHMLHRFSLVPDYVEFDSTKSMILHFGAVRVNIGQDTRLEEKISRTAAILPQITGLSGVLHLEDYSDDTVNIVFEQDV